MTTATRLFVFTTVLAAAAAIAPAALADTETAARTRAEVKQETIAAMLRSQGGLGAILVDLSALARIERMFGGAAVQGLRQQIDALMLDTKDKTREGDLLTRDEKEGDRFILFLSGRRKPRIIRNSQNRIVVTTALDTRR